MSTMEYMPKKTFSSQLGTTVAWQLFQCKWEYTAQLPSNALGVSQRPRRLRAAQQLSNDSTQVSFQISKIFFLFLVPMTISDPENGPMLLPPIANT